MSFGPRRQYFIGRYDSLLGSKKESFGKYFCASAKKCLTMHKIADRTDKKHAPHKQMREHNRLRVLTLIASTLLLSALSAHSEEKRVVLIRACMPDAPFTLSEAQTDSILRRTALYFNSQLADEGFTITFELGPLVQMSGVYDAKKPAYAVREACIAADKAVDFRNYKELVAVLFSGESFWGQQHSLAEEGIELVLDRTKIDEYIAIGENTADAPFSTGVLCHEYAHHLGLQDMYDTDNDGSGGLSKGLWGSISLMDKGNGNDFWRSPVGLGALDFHLLGYGQCDTLTTGGWTLSPFNDSHHYLILPCDNAGEYFLFEARRPKAHDSLIGGEGLLVYHIDRSERKAGYSDYYKLTLNAIQRWERNEVNARPDRQCASILEATPDAKDVKEVFFPYNGAATLCSDGDPAFRDWSGNPMPLALRNITLNADGSVSFSAIKPLTEGKSAVFQDRALMNWEMDGSLVAETDSCILTLTCRGEAIRLKCMPDAQGHIHASVEGLTPGTTYTTRLKLHARNAAYSIKGSISTMRADQRNSTPFIFFTSAVRNKNGTFIKGSKCPLYVYNSSDAERVEWYFNGDEADTDENGFFTIDREGELRAALRYADGSSDMIVKEIIFEK